MSLNIHSLCGNYGVMVIRIQSRASRRPVAALAAAALFAGVAGSGVAQPGAEPIPSDTPGALDIPETWDCRRIEPEYRDWLEAGNTPESWKYVGKTYRDLVSGELYNWQDWLNWANSAGCLPGAAQTTPPAPATGMIMTGAVAALGVGAIAARDGSGPKSPG